MSISLRQSSPQNFLKSGQAKAFSPIVQKIKKGHWVTGFILVLIFQVIGFSLFSKTASLLAADKITLAYTSPAGGALMAAAISEGYFKEENLEVDLVALTVEQITQKLTSGEIKGGEINHLGLNLAYQGAPIVFTAGLYSGFVEILGKKPLVKGDKIILAVSDLDSGPAVAAARYFRSKGFDPDTEITWLKIPDPLAALKNDQATVLARWELKRAQPGQGHGNSHENSHRNSHIKSHGNSHENLHENSLENSKENGPDQAHGQKGAPGQDQGDNLITIFSASASLPAHDPNDTSGNPHAKHTSAHHLFESFVFLDKKLSQREPNTAAAISRALIRGARYLGENEEKAAELAIRENIWKNSKESLIDDFSRYMWMPGVSQAKEHLKYYIHEGLKGGLFPNAPDEKTFFDQVFYQALPEVN
jgi:ABC-type nitrate/sulfonate/bicarbonate transport system substrate-binding protein